MSRFETAKCVFSPSRKARNHGIIGQLSSGIQNLIAQSSQTDEDEDRLVAHSNEILFAKIFRTHTSVRVLLATKSLLHVWSVSGWERDSSALEPERSTVIKTSEGRAFIDACMFGDSRICTIEGFSKSTHIRSYDTTGEVLCEQMMSDFFARLYGKISPQLLALLFCHAKTIEQLLMLRLSFFRPCWSDVTDSHTCLARLWGFRTWFCLEISIWSLRSRFSPFRSVFRWCWTRWDYCSNRQTRARKSAVHVQCYDSVCRLDELCNFTPFRAKALCRA